jgi:hypothetical protein
MNDVRIRLDLCARCHHLHGFTARTAAQWVFCLCADCTVAHLGFTPKETR